MKTLVIAVSALALSTPALAQMEPATPGGSTTQPTTTTQTPATPPVDQSTTTTEAPSTTTATPSDPKALIATEFPTYDKDASGNLDKSEFAAWMGALKAKTGEKPMAPAEMTKWSDGAFATADKDKSKSVTLAELQNYLTGAA